MSGRPCRHYKRHSRRQVCLLQCHIRARQQPHLQEMRPTRTRRWRLRLPREVQLPHRPEAMRPIESANILFVVNGTWGSLVVRSFLAPTDVYVSKEELQETGKRVVICQSGTPRSESYWRKILVGPRSKCISADLRDPSNLATAMEEAERFMYDIDAVVDLIEPPSFEASASIERTSAKVFDDLFDVPVRASFFLAQNAMRALVKSTDGPRRIVSLCQPPLASRTRFRKIGAAAELARTCRALHLVGCAAEFADLEPAVSMVGLWTDDRTVKSGCTYSDCAKAIRAALNAACGADCTDPTAVRELATRLRGAS